MGRCVGRENESGPLSDGIRIDLQNDFSTTITAPGPSARTNFSMTTVDDKIYVWGGEGIEGSLSDGFAYDPNLNTWSKMGDQTDVASRQEHDAFASGSDIVFAGGNSNGQFLYNFNIYNTSTKLWREVGGWGKHTKPSFHKFYGCGRQSCGRALELRAIEYPNAFNRHNTKSVFLS